MSEYVNRPGHDELWGYFGLSRASFVTLPRAFMHEMPDEWQAKMAALLHEWDETWNWPEETGTAIVCNRYENKFTAWPDWIVNYRHPMKRHIDSVRYPSDPKYPKVVDKA